MKGTVATAESRPPRSENGAKIGTRLRRSHPARERSFDLILEALAKGVRYL